jgi:hypothetical protein
MKSRNQFLKLAETRYATYFILLQRMIEVHASLQATIVSQEWNAWSQSNSSQAKKLRDMFLDEDWWSECRYAVSFATPIVELIRYVDFDSLLSGKYINVWVAWWER